MSKELVYNVEDDVVIARIDHHNKYDLGGKLIKKYVPYIDGIIDGLDVKAFDGAFFSYLKKYENFYYILKKNKFKNITQASSSLLQISDFIIVKSTLNKKIVSINYRISTQYDLYKTILYNYLLFHNKEFCYDRIIKLIQINKAENFMFKNDGVIIVRFMENKIEKTKNMLGDTSKIKLRSVSQKDFKNL